MQAAIEPRAQLADRRAAAAPTRDGSAVALLERLDAAIVGVAAEFAALARQYPALIETEALQRAEYPRAFPHLLLTAAPLADPGAAGERLLAADNLDAPRWCLSPAVCLHVYAEFAGQSLKEPLAVTARGRCFRHELNCIPGERQIEFEMREIVFLGTAAWLQETVPLVRDRLEGVARQAGLAGQWSIAEDPFFLPTGQGKAWLQRLQETKWEYQAGDGLALASVNWHRTFFGNRFGLTDGSGEPIHTACLAVGLDRWLSRHAWQRGEVSQ